MLVNKSSTRNWSAVSAVNVAEGSGTPVMFMNASYNNKELNFSKSIQNYEWYKAHKDEVDADYGAFQDEVIKEIG